MYTFISPFGGHGTSALRKLWHRRGWRIHIRPDYIFSFGIDTYDIHSFPKWDEKFKHHQSKGQMLYHRGKEWTRRAGFEPYEDLTISENLLWLLNTTSDSVILFGKQSLSETWLTNNEIKNLILIVRHPLDAYDSLFGRQHPYWGKLKGGVDSILAAEFWCKQWNTVMEDFLSTGNPIYKYEHLAADLEKEGQTDLANLLGPMWYSKPRREFITPKLEEYIKQLTWDNFKQLYTSW
jgi:hypothetical protein